MLSNVHKKRDHFLRPFGIFPTQRRLADEGVRKISAAFYDYIQEFPASDAERFRILGIVRNFNQYADELAEMLKPVVTAIVSSASVYTPLLERFAEAYQEKQPEEVFGTEEAVPVYDPSAQVLELYPRLFIIDEYYTITYQLSNSTQLCNQLEISVLYDAAKLYQKREIPLRDIASCIKRSLAILCDCKFLPC